MSRAFTAAEVRAAFLKTIRGIARYWAHDTDGTVNDKCNGVAFSILNIFDGSIIALPAMDIVLRPHPDDTEYCRKQGENWFKNSQLINDCILHDEYYSKELPESSGEVNKDLYLVIPGRKESSPLGINDLSIASLTPEQRVALVESCKSRNIPIPLLIPINLIRRATMGKHLSFEQLTEGFE